MTYPVACWRREFAVKHRGAEWEGGVTTHCPTHTLHWGHVALVSETRDTCHKHRDYHRQWGPHNVVTMDGSNSLF